MGKRAVSQSRRDDSLQNWEGVAVLCRSTNGRSLLMVLQGRPDEEPSWAVPGGSREPGETPEQAAIREVKEETGLDVRIVRPYAVVEGVKDYGAFRAHYFQGDIVGGKTPKTSEVSEISEILEVVGGAAKAGDPDGLIHRVVWVPADRLPDLRLSQEDQRQVLMAFMGVS